MTLIQGKKGEKLLVKDIKERELDSRLLRLGLCRGDEFTIKNIIDLTNHYHNVYPVEERNTIFPNSTYPIW